MSLGALRDDDRGLALGIVVFIAMLVMGGLLFLVLNTAFTEVVGFTAPQASHDGARDQINMARTIWNNILYVPLFLGFLFLITRAVQEGSV